MPFVETTTRGRHAADAAQRLQARMLDGWQRAYARQNQMLPYAGTSLTAGELEMLCRHLDDHSSPAAGPTSASAALISAVLTTGRSASSFADLPVYVGNEHPPTEPCLRIGSDWVWWLTPGRPSSRQKLNADVEPQSAKRDDLIALPCSLRTRRLVEGMQPHPRPGHPLFPWDACEARAEAHGEIRRAGVRCSLRLVEGWLFQRLSEMEFGDAAVAAIITGDVPLIAKTVIHYTSVSASMAVAYLGRALEGVDIVDQPIVIGGEQRFGSRFAPQIGEVVELLARVRQPLLIRRKLRKKPVIAMHNAMTLYTVLFYLIATCARPTRRPLPAFDQIDPLTGFQILDDKPAKDGSKTRLIWVSQECRQQLSLYQSHLDAMRQRHPHLVPDDHDGSPYLITDNGVFQDLDQRALRRALVECAWPYPPNFARHFVRSTLIGKVRSETLHAFFGHWHLGTEPWSHTAALDPLSYRDELQAAVSSLCDACKLEPQRGL